MKYFNSSLCYSMMMFRSKIEKAFCILKSDGLKALFNACIQYRTDRRTPHNVDESKIAFEALKAHTFKGLMVDVGAHFGSAFAPFAYNGWNVYAFEPDSENRKILKSSFSRLQNVIIDNRAISDHLQTAVTLYRSKESTGISGLSAFHPSHQAGEEVDVTTLECFFNEQEIKNKNIDFLKIDTEGFDLHVLKGIPWNSISPRLILCEFEDSKTIPLGYTFHDLALFLEEKGYKLIISEWHPIKKYGVPHDWKRFTTYPCVLEVQKAWGNILATNDATMLNSLSRICEICY